MQTELVTLDFDDAEIIRTLKDTVCKGATDSQFRLFVEVCRATGLNPLLKEIWYVPSVGVMAGRDGYLAVANRHPQFDGMKTVVERDGKNVPIKATCQVWRKDRSHPIECEAYFSEYRKGGNVWSTYPSAMISKVAEVLALKRSFAINGLVTEEEIGQQPVDDQRGTVEDQQAVAQQRIAQLSAAVDIAPVAPQAAKKGKLPFDVLKSFSDVKAALREVAGTDEWYYRILGENGFDKSNQIEDVTQARNIYKSLAAQLRDLRLAAANGPLVEATV